jgi:DNA-directed RNA polymerase sigma subunit (sigma70/sigma32)
VPPEPSDPVADHLRAVESVPPLTSQEEGELWEALKHGDDAGVAHKRLMEANLRSVLPIAVRYEGRGVPLADLVQEGNIGLQRAVEAFDPSEGGDFSSSASRRIEDAIVGVLGD